MSAPLDQRIDELIARQYPKRKYGELRALSKLFDNRFLTGLEGVLNEGSTSYPNYQWKYKVSLGWIDKIPLASFVNREVDHYKNPINNKVELGDLLLVFSHIQVGANNPSAPNVVDSRAAIVQAKVAKRSNPLVPIGKLSKSRAISTNKELCLLSRWPRFNLFKASRSKYPILENLRIEYSQEKALFSGYYDRMWYCGQPEFEAPCDDTLGRVFEKLMHGVTGERFKTKETGKDWDRLITKLIELCQGYDLPRHLFEKPENRYFGVKMAFFNPVQMLIDLIRPRRFPILFITKYELEGEFQEGPKWKF